MRPRRLALRRETLTALTNDGLAAVQGGTSIQEFERITANCRTFPDFSECLSVTPPPAWTQFCKA